MAVPVHTRQQVRRPAQRWEPLRDLEDLQSRTLELLETAMPGVARELPLDNLAWVPPVDIEETDDAWIVEADLPGARSEDISLEVHNNEVQVSGDIVERERKGILRRRSRRTGSFSFRVAVPGEIDAEGVEANLRDGVLTIRIPRAEKAHSRRVTVGSSATSTDGAPSQSSQATEAGSAESPGTA